MIKKPQKAGEIVVQSYDVKKVSDPNANWDKLNDWFWPTIDRHIKKPEKTDYILFLLVPLFVLRILLPLFTIIFHKSISPFSGDTFLKDLKVNLF